jgi:alpha-L-rhamnosidase
MGLEQQVPRLSWELESDRRNVRQTAYRILVATSEDALESGRVNLWDSGTISSGISTGIAYGGFPLISRQRCVWCVQVWDEKGQPSDISDLSSWEMGLMSIGDWVASWINVENSTAKADREAGLTWVWGPRNEGRAARAFRGRFVLPEAATSGELFATTNDYTVFARITGVWLDGIEIARSASSSDWNDDIQLNVTEMSAGEHLLAVETTTLPLAPGMAAGGFEDALTVFLRLKLQSGESVGHGSGRNWKSSKLPEGNWYSLDYDDSPWEFVRILPLPLQPWPPSPAMCLRREFWIGRTVRCARLYATALGAYEPRLNGKRIGEAMLSPDRSAYDKHLLYQTFDVTRDLVTGENVLGFIVGDGWYGASDRGYSWGPPPRRLLAQLELTFADGSRQIVSTDDGWFMAESAIRRSVVRVGEIYDARLAQSGWDNIGFNQSSWNKAAVGEKPTGRIVAQVTPPIRVTEVLQPKAIVQCAPGVYLFDFAQNFAGWCRLQVKGLRAQKIKLKFGELLTSSGRVDQPFMNIGEPKVDEYILRGDEGGETFEPHFTYRGFRYVEVEGLSSPPTANTLKGVVAHTDFEMTGRFWTCVPLINRIWEASVWTRRSNFVGVPTDCPSREQRGYLESSGLCWDDAAFNMDVCALTSHLMTNIVDQQAADGAFPIAAPLTPLVDALDHIPGINPGYSDAGIILPWTAWQRYGDVRVIEQNWDAMVRYHEFIMRNNPDYIGRNGHALDWGDWLSIDLIEVHSGVTETPKELIGTAYWACIATKLAEMGGAIGRCDDADRFRAVATRVRTAFNREFVKPGGVIGTGSQTGYVLALRFDLLLDDVKLVAARQLAANIRARGISLTTGILGTCNILDALTDAGYAELAYGLLLREDYPSWGYMIRQGATTIWETWHGIQEQAGPNGEVLKVQLARNHSDLATVSGFLFRRVAGIDAASPGFEIIRIHPVMDHRISSAGGEYQSIMGRISTEWSRDSEGNFSLRVRIPANTSARIHFPVGSNAKISENRDTASGQQPFRIVSRTEVETVVEIGSGSYDFNARPIDPAHLGGGLT